jgi:hypothetical protein
VIPVSPCSVRGFVHSCVSSEFDREGIDGAGEWARADATPAEQEITRIRALIARINSDIAQLTDAERAQIDQAVNVVRRHRAVSLGMPAIRPAAAAAKVTG